MSMLCSITCHVMQPVMLLYNIIFMLYNMLCFVFVTLYNLLCCVMFILRYRTCTVYVMLYNMLCCVI